MRSILANIVLWAAPQVRALHENRKQLLIRTAELEAENNVLLKKLKAAECAPGLMPYDFDTDGMRLWDKNLKSLSDPRFVDAYARGVAPGVHIEFRAYVACWAASHASEIQGDFVECGVNEGWLSLTICNFLDFNSIDKSFWLFDTYNGIPSEQIAERESARAALHHYVDCYETTKAKFAPFTNAKLVRGRVPDSLLTAQVDRVSYLSIDMNIAKPELDAIKFYWPKISSGGVVVLDDYGFGGYEAQHEAMDEFAAGIGVSILTLPTGQGLIFKR